MSTYIVPFKSCSPTALDQASESVLNSSQELFNKFSDAVTEGNSTKVASLFCEDHAVLWGTVSSVLRTNPTEIKSYFDYFASPKNVVVGNCSTVSQFEGNIYEDDRAVHWSLDGTEASARMTFVMKLDSGNSSTNDCIRFLHSSLFPHAPAGLVAADKQNNLTFDWQEVPPSTTCQDDLDHYKTVAWIFVGLFCLSIIGSLVYVWRLKSAQPSVTENAKAAKSEEVIKDEGVESGLNSA